MGNSIWIYVNIIVLPMKSSKLFLVSGLLLGEVYYYYHARRIVIAEFRHHRNEYLSVMLAIFYGLIDEYLY